MNPQISTDIIIVLDESGSMNNIKLQTMKSLNELVKEQTMIDGNSRLTLWTFSNVSRLIIDNIPLNEIQEYTDFNPSGLTALNDSVYFAINHKLQSSNCKNVCFIIITDGFDNFSTKINKINLKKMIEKVKRKYNWQFIYLGANQDSCEIGNSYNITICNNFNTDNQSIQNIVRATSDNVLTFRRQVSQGFKNLKMRSVSEPNSPLKYPNPPNTPNTPTNKYELNIKINKKFSEPVSPPYLSLDNCDKYSPCYQFPPTSKFSLQRRNSVFPFFLQSSKTSVFDSPSIISSLNK